MKDYYFATARIRALEPKIVGREKLELLLEAKNQTEGIALLKENGILPVMSANRTLSREETILGILKSAYGEISECNPDGEGTALWLLPYDCNNLKAAIKCFLRNVSTRGMLFDFGRIPVEKVENMVREKDFDGCTPFMKAAATEAISAYEKTGNPQQIDLILDKACYADMLAEAKKSKSEFVKRLVQAKIDLTNLLITARILRMNMGEVGRLFLKESLIPGGLLDEKTLLSCYEVGEKELWNRISFTDYGRFADGVKESDGSLRAMERLSDDCFMEFVKEAKMISVGVEVLVGFLLAHETEAKNLRILFSGWEAGLSKEQMRERMRESYV